MYRGTACFAIKQLFEWQNIIQQQNISTRHQGRFRLKTALYCRFVSKLWSGIPVHGDAEQEVESHPFSPSSVLRLSALQSVSVYKLYSRPPCIVLNLCFWFRPELFSSWDSNEWLTCRRTVLPACCPRVRNLKRSREINCTSASPWLSALVIICDRLCSPWQKSDSNCKQNIYILPFEPVCFNCPRSTELPEALLT